ncbi:unnamed protein product, partial [Acanthocheilonema viteae]
MQNPTTTLTKIPPIPPKPKLQYQHGQIAKFGQLSRSIAGGQLPPPPGDSDTDSGICADSDNQLSPRHINAGFLDDKPRKLQRKFEIPVYREHLTPESAWTIKLEGKTDNALEMKKIEMEMSESKKGKEYLNGLKSGQETSELHPEKEVPSLSETDTSDHSQSLHARRVHTNLSKLSYQRRLPEGLQTNCYNSQTSRNGKQYRVRFADQVSSTDGGSSFSSSGWDNIDQVSVNSCDGNYSDYYLHRSTRGIATITSTISVNNPDQVLSTISESNNRIKLPGQQQTIDDQFIGCSNHPQPEHKHQISGSDEQDDTASASPPQSSPGYSVAMTRLRRSDDQHLIHSNGPPFRVIRRFHNRSTSLPRGVHRQSIALEIRRGSIDCFHAPHDYSSLYK